MPWSAIDDAIAGATGSPYATRHRAPVGGGSINAAYRLEGQQSAWFVKLNHAGALAMFQAEAEGLQELAAADAIRVPRPLTWGEAGGRSYLVMEWLTLHGRGDNAALGESLAHMHRTTAARHGWHRDNTIGSTEQINTPDSDWVRFYTRQRLQFQLQLAADNGHGGSLQRAGERLCEQAGAFFSDYTPSPSLLHGDLWSGNIAFDDARQPVLYDPAVHYGDRESDLAMSELFGRLPEAVYDAYNAVWPLDAGYPVRRDLYQLYHVLNHLNLFGGMYASQAEHLIGRLLAEVR
ncbi:fructosamine kinase family protein [Aquisalimonas asiatica]|uniref:Fructosamine-3-kinase n=1 Tax=Aquisalimonas asiatica TaxID=406100 RepID=A0A1H8TDH7_9GAMM|nr:fructosamine kinase family protein [Aquisalimonas asiatica]SEO88885.1 Fructosamine-3-kinase [Aquisalimonas asiatica]